MSTDHEDARGGASPPCAELPGDVLGEIAGLLYDAGDLVRFRAVCRPWREAAAPSRKQVLPWLVESRPWADAPGLLVHSPFSARKTRHLLPLSALRGMKIAGSDTSSGRAIAVGKSDEGRTVALINPLDGDAALLPLLPESKSSLTEDNKWRSAIVVACSNGTVVLYTFEGRDLAVIQLRPGDPGWEEVDVTCPVGVNTKWLCPEKRRATALWSSVVPPGVACGVPTQPWTARACERRVLEFRGEILMVDVDMPERFTRGSTTPNPMSVRVNKMQVEDHGWHQWVQMESTDHLCFFFGYTSSFAVDAREYAGSGVTGGCVYITFWPMKWTEKEEVCSVYRYCFRSGTATLVDELPTGLVMPMWFMPRPSLSPSLPRVP